MFLRLLLADKLAIECRYTENHTYALLTQSSRNAQTVYYVFKEGKWLRPPVL